MYNCIYINLDERTDRNEHFIKEMGDLSGTKLNFYRYSADKASPGYIGCALSHINALKYAKEKGWDSVIIFEDDFEFVVSHEKFSEQIDYLFTLKWDVCILAGVVNTCYYYDEGAKATRVNDAQTTTCYVIRSHYYDILIERFTRSYNNLNDDPCAENYRIYAIDQYWKKLQHRDNWIISIPLIGKQYANYSDIGNMHIDYEYIFYNTEINKKIMPPRNTTS